MCVCVRVGVVSRPVCVIDPRSVKAIRQQLLTNCCCSWMDGLKTALLKGQSVTQAGHNKEHRLYGPISETRIHRIRSASAGDISFLDYFTKNWGGWKHCIFEEWNLTTIPSVDYSPQLKGSVKLTVASGVETTANAAKWLREWFIRLWQRL